MFFKEWVNSQVLYVKDLININGNLITDKELFEKFANKTNIVSQLYIIKNSILKN